MIKVLRCRCFFFFFLIICFFLSPSKNKFSWWQINNLPTFLVKIKVTFLSKNNNNNSNIKEKWRHSIFFFLCFIIIIIICFFFFFGCVFLWRAQVGRYVRENTIFSITLLFLLSLGFFYLFKKINIIFRFLSCDILVFSFNTFLLCRITKSWTLL